MFFTNRYIACSSCFQNRGLELEAKNLGTLSDKKCRNCGVKKGVKLTKDQLLNLAHKFFVWGSFHRTDYGGAPLIQFNDSRKGGEVDFGPSLSSDARLIEKMCGIGLFYYGPRMWMVGDIEPLEDLQKVGTRCSVISRILSEYPELLLETGKEFFRVRRAPENPSDQGEYDSPPFGKNGDGRLSEGEFKVLYGSPDLELCVHECRFAAEDELYVATLSLTKPLRLLNLANVLMENVTEFESLDLSIHMLFLAGQHSYEITREISVMASEAGFDGIVYPSYFSELRLGVMPLRTSYGLSNRVVPEMHDAENSLSVSNYAIFGRPVEEGKIEVKCINKLIMRRVRYDFHFGPDST